MLREYNAGQVGPANHVPLWFFAASSGKVQGGVRGQTYWSWCAIDVLTVAEPYRRQGIGSRLLARVEEIARARGCVGIRLDTTSFQAPDFYRRHGTSNLVASGLSAGLSRLWFMKRFEVTDD